MKTETEIETELARLLLECWDPLNISDYVAAPRGEYLYDARQILVQLRRSIDRDALVALLMNATGTRSPVERPRDRAAATAVMSWWASSHQRRTRRRLCRARRGQR